MGGVGGYSLLEVNSIQGFHKIEIVEGGLSQILWIRRLGRRYQFNVFDKAISYDKSTGAVVQGRI